jgi:DNA (cytosine-5)-methyltransferase 1
MWLTPNVPNGGRVNPADMSPTGKMPDGTKRQVGLENQAKMWPTITAHTPDMESNGPNGHQGTYLAGAVKAWATPKASDPQHSGPNMRDSAGNYALPAQVTKSWLTPKVPSGGSQAERTTAGGGLRKLEDQTQTPTGKLNPRWVETLMGLPIGWTMPSCTSPQTIEPMSCDSSAMELSLPPQSELSGFSLAS